MEISELTCYLEIGNKNRIDPTNKTKYEKKQSYDEDRNSGIAFTEAAYLYLGNILHCDRSENLKFKLVLQANAPAVIMVRSFKLWVPSLAGTHGSSIAKPLYY